MPEPPKIVTPRAKGARPVRRVLVSTGRADRDTAYVSGTCTLNGRVVKGTILSYNLVARHKGAAGYNRWAIGFRFDTVGVYDLEVVAHDAAGGTASAHRQVSVELRGLLGLSFPHTHDNLYDERDNLDASGELSADEELGPVTLTDTTTHTEVPVLHSAGYPDLGFWYASFDVLTVGDHYELVVEDASGGSIAEALDLTVTPPPTPPPLSDGGPDKGPGYPVE